MPAETPKGKAGPDDLQAQLDALKSEIAALVAALRQDGLKAAEAFAAQAGKTAGEAGQEARAALEDIRAEAARIEAGLEAQVREKPLQSMLMAFGLGLFVSVLLRR
jgi:ElaB/YqjD/DUF883 family membrane-anchored ribosome-binding protein